MPLARAMHSASASADDGLEQDHVVQDLDRLPRARLAAMGDLAGEMAQQRLDAREGLGVPPTMIDSVPSIAAWRVRAIGASAKAHALPSNSA